MGLTEKTFKSGMAALGVVYDRDVTDPELNSIYWLALCDFPDDSVRRAFTQVITTCKWFPRVADIVEAIEGARKNMGKLAWAEVKGKLHTWGGMWNHVWPTDGAIAEAVKALGGWSYLSGLRIYDIGQMEDVFLAAYDRAVACGLQYRPGEVIGCRDRDWRTNEYLPLIAIREEGQKTVQIESAFKAGETPGRTRDESTCILPGEIEEKMASLMTAKKLN